MVVLGLWFQSFRESVICSSHQDSHNLLPRSPEVGLPPRTSLGERPQRWLTCLQLGFRKHWPSSTCCVNSDNPPIREGLGLLAKSLPARAFVSSVSTLDLGMNNPVRNASLDEERLQGPRTAGGSDVEGRAGSKLWDPSQGFFFFCTLGVISCRGEGIVWAPT